MYCIAVKRDDERANTREPAVTTLIRSLALLAGLALGYGASAQTYPAKPIRMIVTFGPGGCFAMVWESRQRVRLRLTPPMPAAEIGGCS